MVLMPPEKGCSPELWKSVRLMVFTLIRKTNKDEGTKNEIFFNILLILCNFFTFNLQLTIFIEDKKATVLRVFD